jgi:hypothetical protein
MYSEEWLSSEGMTRIWLSDSGEREELAHSHTVDVDLVLLHKLPQPGKAICGIDLLHVYVYPSVSTSPLCGPSNVPALVLVELYRRNIWSF